MSPGEQLRALQRPMTNCLLMVLLWMFDLSGLNGMHLNPFLNKPLYKSFENSTSLLKTVGKGGIAPNEQFLPFPGVF